MERVNWQRARSRLDRWSPWVMSIALIVIGISIVGDAFTEPSVWRWFLLGLWTVCVPGTLLACTKGLRSGDGERTLRGLGPADVPKADVHAAIDSTTDLVAATKALRQRHRGLGLKEARDLVTATAEESDQG
ncbi:hypothetical protein [Rhodococcus sp. 27YEA15]|uniref:hypothetical protein n=1 Tax=Rhodococcus sp. 27YEA15 TaxID=3156259 RepID=UPI003C7E749F